MVQINDQIDGIRVNEARDLLNLNHRQTLPTHLDPYIWFTATRSRPVDNMREVTRGARYLFKIHIHPYLLIKQLSQ